MIKGQHINVRLMKESDLETFVDLSNDMSQTGPCFPYNLKTYSETKKIFNETGFFSANGGRLLIVNKTDEILGAIWFFKNAHYVKGYEVGYQIFKMEDRGKGYTSEALKLFTSFLFEHFPINRLQVCMEEANKASEAVAIKCGYTLEGKMRDAWTVAGRTITNLVYSMIRSEVPKLKDVIG